MSEFFIGTIDKDYVVYQVNCQQPGMDGRPASDRHEESISLPPTTILPEQLHSASTSSSGISVTETGYSPIGLSISITPSMDWISSLSPPMRKISTSPTPASRSVALGDFIASPYLPSEAGRVIISPEALGAYLKGRENHAGVITARIK